MLRTGIASLAAAFLALAGCRGPDSSVCTDVDFAEILSPELVEYLKDTSREWVNEARACQIGGYVVYGPRDTDQLHLLVGTGESDIVLIEGKTLNVVEAGQPLLTLDDKAQDGRFDYLSYQIRRGDFWLNVIDKNLDGQADLKFTGGEDRQFWMWFRDAWREVDAFNAPDPNLISIDGEWRPYTVVDEEIVLLDQ